MKGLDMGGDAVFQLEANGLTVLPFQGQAYKNGVCFYRYGRPYAWRMPARGSIFKHTPAEIFSPLISKPIVAPIL
ncbi:MAG: hypothetical protein KH366_10370 [Clostridiaceae bacterium]|nr:hypothetical protein [Clostridiaceae bacterium]